MTTTRAIALAAVAAFVIAFVTAPAGSSASPTCGPIAQIKDPFEQLRRTGMAYIDFGMQNPNHYRLMFMTPHPPIEFDGEDAARKGNPEEDAYAFLKGIISAGIAQGRFRGDLKDVDLIAQTVWAGVHGVISLQIAKCNDDWVDWKPLKKRATFMVETLIDGLKRV